MRPSGSRTSLDARTRATSSPGSVIRVLLVEDDDFYRSAVAEALSEHGFAVQSFADGASLLHSLVAAAAADIIILEWSLPKMSGIDLLAELRRLGIDVPVLFLTDQTHTSHETLAFEKGASDFIDKARGVDVIVRRVKRVVEGAKSPADQQPDERMVFGKLVLRPKVRRAYWNGVDIGLTVGQFDVVHLLVSNAGRYLTYRAIYDRLRGEGFAAGRGDKGYQGNVRTTMRRIRNKFRERDSSFAEIENYHRFGYCWRNTGSPTAREPAPAAKAVVKYPATGAITAQVPRILVAEDNLLEAAMVQQLLQDAGYQVIGPVARVGEALYLAQQEEIDGALLDINLAGMDAFAVGQCLQDRHVPFAFMSGYTRSYIARAGRLQSVPLIGKPLDKDEVLQTVATFAT